jgi:hypothetical protein
MNEVKAFIEELPKDLVELKGDKLELVDPSKASLFESYLERNKVDFIMITKDPTKLLFSFETDGSMSAKTALQESINILTKKYEEFRKNLKDL